MPPDLYLPDQRQQRLVLVERLIQSAAIFGLLLLILLAGLTR